MKIYGIKIKPGMVIETMETNYVAFPFWGRIAFANINYGGWRSSEPEDIYCIRDRASKENNIKSGKILYKVGSRNEKLSSKH